LLGPRPLPPLLRAQPPLPLPRQVAMVTPSPPLELLPRCPLPRADRLPLLLQPALQPRRLWQRAPPAPLPLPLPLPRGQQQILRRRPVHPPPPPPLRALPLRL
jgi:hypothetical protein